MQNLEVKSAKLAERLAEGGGGEREKLLTDGLGVLQEQGLYAFFLYLRTSKKGNPRKVIKECADFLRGQRLLRQGSDDVFKAVRELAERVDDLLFARDLLIQALTYARYHAKAEAEGVKEQ